jgi:hypothetical protein
MKKSGTCLFTGIKMQGLTSLELRVELKGKNFYQADSHIPGARFIHIDLNRFIEEYAGVGVTFDIDVYSHVAYIDAINHPKKS